VTPDLVFLDRDGTLNRKAAEGDYVDRPEQVELLPGVAGAVRRLNAAGVPVVVVTNQRGVALGRMTQADVSSVNATVGAQLGREGAVVDAWLVCPHGEGVCDCRKPGPGLLEAGLAAHPLARADRCVVVGDAETDMQAGRAIGVSGVLLAATPPEHTVAVCVRPDLSSAVDWLLGVDRRGVGPSSRSTPWPQDFAR
jgi:D-glycero-D-manno-heptose 1,7-bisphosphate phosphatase